MQRSLSPMVSVRWLTREAFSLPVIRYIFYAGNAFCCGIQRKLGWIGYAALEGETRTSVHACMACTEARAASWDGCGYACACWSWLLFDLCRKAEVFRKSCSLNSDVISLSRRPSPAYLLWAALYEHPNELNKPDLSDHFGIISIFFEFHEHKNLLDKVSRGLWLSFTDL